MALEGVKGEAARAASALEGEQALVKALRAEVEGLTQQIAGLQVCGCGCGHKTRGAPASCMFN